jgi:hypothetical protein
VEGKNREEYPAAKPMNGDAMTPPRTGSPIAHQPHSNAINAQPAPEADDAAMALLVALMQSLPPGNAVA